MVDINVVKIQPNLNVVLGSKKRVGILNRGKNNKFTDNIFKNLDIGIEDQGEDTIAEGNKIE